MAEKADIATLGLTWGLIPAHSYTHKLFIKEFILEAMDRVEPLEKPVVPVELEAQVAQVRMVRHLQ